MLTVASREPRWTQAGEGVDAIHAGATIEAGALRAVWRVVLTVDAVEAGWTGARVAVHAVSAVGTIAAGVAGTLVDVFLTKGALEAGQAVAEGRVDAICAGAPIVTRVRPTVVNIALTVAARVASLAKAAVATVSVLAGSAMATRALHTLIDVDLAGLPLPSSRADARKTLVVLGLLANPAVLAGAGGTGGQHYLACGSCVGQWTVAVVPGNVIDAGALVQARVGCTLVDIGLAVGAWRERGGDEEGMHPWS